MDVHICTHGTLTQEQIELYEKEYGLKLLCSRCGKRLEPGDRKDHFWPFFCEFNRCKCCMKKEKEVV